MNVLTELGRVLLFIKEILQDVKEEGIDRTEAAVQTLRIFRESLFTSAQAGFFVGAITTVQFSVQVKQFDALSYLGALVTSGTIRETGPLLIAFMLSGKVGAFTSAELGTMRVTEQIDALRCLGANPYYEIIVPRFIGIIIASFFLLFVGMAMSMIGGFLLATAATGVSLDEYLRFIPQIVTFFSVGSGFVKCLVYSVILATVCIYFGYNTSGGAQGVGKSVVATATSTLVCIVLADWFTSFIGDVILTIGMGL